MIPFKRLFDLFFSFAGILMLAPLMLVVALLVKLTFHGPVLVRTGGLLDIGYQDGNLAHCLPDR